MVKKSVVFASILLSGCAAKYVQNDVSLNAEKLDRRLAVTIALPEDGRYEGKSYDASGEMTAAAIKAGFAHYASEVKVLDSCRDVACMRKHGIPGYLVVPEILHWEERATEWSGIPDRIEVKLAIYGEEDEPLASAVLSGKSKWATFGGDHPQDLLPKPIAEYVKSQY